MHPLPPDLDVASFVFGVLAGVAGGLVVCAIALMAGALWKHR